MKLQLIGSWSQCHACLPVVWLNGLYLIKASSVGDDLEIFGRRQHHSTTARCDNSVYVIKVTGSMTGKSSCQERDHETLSQKTKVCNIADPKASLLWYSHFHKLKYIFSFSEKQALVTIPTESCLFASIQENEWWTVAHDRVLWCLLIFGVVPPLARKRLSDDILAEVYNFWLLRCKCRVR